MVTLMEMQMANLVFSSKKKKKKEEFKKFLLKKKCSYEMQNVNAL